MTSKIDVAFDTSHTTKSENLPVQVTSIRLNKDNYLSWSATLEIGITSCGRLPYITGEKPAPSKTDPRWATWALEDSQVKVWIISSVSADIQPLILRKSTSYDMWTVLARMYGRKKRVLRTYQIKRNIYSLKQGDLSVASFYAALKTKWEELDYHVNDDWNCGSDHALYWEKEWMDRTFIFLGGLRDEFESIRSQILNCDEIPGIEEVYARVESEEQ
uniref:Retrotransposon Copia-like N-terminal domain-containing protein n=1 Tax=Nymphaea colorata TaxID=210225 RepID=A0A5K1C0K3_9MAGN